MPSHSLARSAWVPPGSPDFRIIEPPKYGCTENSTRSYKSLLVTESRFISASPQPYLSCTSPRPIATSTSSPASLQFLNSSSRSFYIFFTTANMDFLRRNSLGPILPIIAPFTSSPGTQSPARQDSGGASSAHGHTQGHSRKWSSLFRTLERIDIERANEHGHHQRRESLVTSPFSDGTVCVEPEDEDGGRRMEKQGTDTTMVNNVPQQEEKPGSGHIWDVWTIMPKNVRRWDKPARCV